MRHMIRLSCALLSALLLSTTASDAVSTTWNVASGDWGTPGNWSGGAVPAGGDDVVVNSGTVTISSDSAELASFTMADGTLTFTNWGTRLFATNTSIDNATVTLPAAFTNNAMSNGVWFVCSNDFTLGSNATIDVTGLGFAKQNGPGCPANTYAYGGGGHGGVGSQ